jgi:hypothetical protein
MSEDEFSYQRVMRECNWPRQQGTRIPIDDEHAMLWLVQKRNVQSAANAMGRPSSAGNAAGRTGAMEDLPNESSWLGR